MTSKKRPAVTFSGVVEEDGWTLMQVTSVDIDELATWFDNADDIFRWGGAGIPFPFTRESFHDGCLWREMLSFRLNDSKGVYSAFGQLYERHDRINLARLVVHPKRRGRGVGKQLVGMLMVAGRVSFTLDEFSLFVFRDNTPAFECYRSMGFVVTDFPEEHPMADVTYYLTRPV